MSKQLSLSEINPKQAQSTIVKQQVKVNQTQKEELVQTTDQRFHYIKFDKKNCFIQFSQNQQLYLKCQFSWYQLGLLFIILNNGFQKQNLFKPKKFSKMKNISLLMSINDELKDPGQNHLINYKINENIVKTKGLFSVYMQNEQNRLLYQISKNKAQIQIIGVGQLQYLVNKWNSQTEILAEMPPNVLINLIKKSTKSKTNQIRQKKTIELSKININDKKMLLVFLKLYYYGGTYVNLQLLSSNFKNKCLRLVVFDFDILFIQTKELLDNDIRVPDFSKMIGVRYPYTPMVRRMIENIIDNKNYDQQCRQRQCLIVKCIQDLQKSNLNSQTLNQSKAVKQFARQNSKFNFYNYSHYIINDTIKNQKQYQIKANTTYSIFNLISLVEAVDVEDKQQHKSSIYPWSNSSSQIFQFIPQDNIGRKFKIYSPNYNKTMKIQNGQCSNGSRIIFGDQKSQQDQIWELVPISQMDTSNYQINDLNYFFYIRSFCGKSIKVDRLDFFTQQNPSIILSDNKGLFNQAWALYPAYNPQYQYNNIQQYEQSYINALYHLPSIMSYSQIIVRTIYYLKLRIQTLRVQTPYWIYVPNYEPQQIDIYSESNCAKRHQITYIWLGQKELPFKYQDLINKCSGKAKVLGEIDFAYYTKLWNDEIDDYQFIIAAQTIQRFLTRVTLLKFLFLYFQTGIYSDFDTQINEQCFENIYSQDLLWTNNFKRQLYGGVILVPEQNFMKVDRKYHPTVKFFIQMLLSTKYHNERWRQCQIRQCLIVGCQGHLKDHSYN